MLLIKMVTDIMDLSQSRIDKIKAMALYISCAKVPFCQEVPIFTQSLRLSLFYFMKVSLTGLVKMLLLDDTG